MVTDASHQLSPDGFAGRVGNDILIIGEYVTALEPGTNPPIGQGNARKQKKLIHIAPGKSKTYDLEMKILTDKKQIAEFLKAAGQ